MKILMLVQYFHLPDEPGGSRAFQFARRWAALGHDVTVLTGNVNYKTGRVIRPQAGRTWSLLKHPDGFRVYRLWTYAQFRGSFRKRLLFFASYAAHAALAGSVGGRPDVVFASSTPLTVGLPGWWLARRYRCPFVFELRDLWPEAAVAAGVMRSPRWIARTRKLASFLYARADHLIAVTEGIRDGILGYGVPGEKVTLVPNGVDDWMDPERFGTEPAVSEADPRPLRCLYVGAHGIWNNLETLLAAARVLRDDPRVAFTFLGDGDAKPSLIEEALRDGLRNVRFLDAVPKEEAFAAMVACDVGLIAASGHPHNRQTLPNKIFDYMAASVPVVVAAGEGEMRDLLARSRGGFASPPEDGEALAALLLRLAAMSGPERRAVGAAGRAYVMEHYARTRLAETVAGIFRRLVEGSSARRHPETSGARPAPANTGRIVKEETRRA